MTGPPWPIDDINTWDRETFVARLGGVFESSPWIAAVGWEQRPFKSLEDLLARLTEIVRASSAERQLALIRAHPDLVGQAALAGTLTRESTREQAAADLDPGSLSPEEIHRFRALNLAYRERFRFPFVICARDNRKASIIAGLEARIANSLTQERRTALDEIAKIAWYRLADLVVSGDQMAERHGS